MILILSLPPSITNLVSLIRFEPYLYYLSFSLTGPSKPPTKKPTPAPTPAPTDPPTAKPETPKPDGVHLACKPGTTYDAIVVEEDTRGSQKTHFFHGDSFFTLEKNLRRGDVKKVKDYFPEVRTPINAAYRNKQGNVVFFTGSK